MNQQAGLGRRLTYEDLPRLHNLTKEVSKFCRGQLRTYLDALAPLFRPRRVLGDHVESADRHSVANADENMAELQETYFRACGRPFDLRRELPTPLESVPTQIQFYEWEYVHEARSERDRKAINIVAPLTWVLAYRSTYSLSMLRQVMAGKQERDAESIRTFALRACLLHLLFAKLPDLNSIFEGLRYTVEVRKSPQLGDLPLVTISAPLHTVRPTDDLLVRATSLSGRTSFDEVLDESHASRIPDPLQNHIRKILDHPAETD
jgi:hypothetical protein